MIAANLQHEHTRKTRHKDFLRAARKPGDAVFVTPEELEPDGPEFPLGSDFQFESLRGFPEVPDPAGYQWEVTKAGPFRFKEHITLKEGGAERSRSYGGHGSTAGQPQRTNSK